MPYFGGGGGGADHGALQTLASAAVQDPADYYPSSSYGGSSGMNGAAAFSGGGRAMEIEGVTGNGLRLASGSNQMEGVLSDEIRGRAITRCVADFLQLTTG